MPVLKLNHCGTKRAMLHESLQGLPLIGRGMFCAVFDRGDTVLKLTADRIQYHFYTDYCAPTGDYYPTLVQNHGPVGRQDETDLYLVEMEKLTKIGLRAECSDRAWIQRRELMKAYERHRCRLVSKFWHILNPVTFSNEVSSATLYEVSSDESLEEDIRDLCGELSTFVSDYACSADFHRANFMLRGDQLVLNDVVADVESLCAYKSIHRC